MKAEPNDMITVTLPLSVFDEMRTCGRECKNIAARLARCFDYKCEKRDSSPPMECINCERETECSFCEIGAANPAFLETLTVDTERLIRVAKEYALYGKDIETDIDAITITEKAKVKQ